MNRTYRKLAGLIGIASVVFAQLALSAYACPMALQSLDETARQVNTSEGATDAPDLASTALCQKHCDNEQQNVNDAPQPPATVSLEPTTVILPVIKLALSLQATAFTRSLFHATSLPASIRNCCFRI